MTHRPDCNRTGWTETTSHTGTVTWRCNDCRAVTIPTLLAQTIAETMAGKTVEQGIDDLIRTLRIPESVSTSGNPVRQEYRRAGDNQSLLGGVCPGHFAACYVAATPEVS